MKKAATLWVVAGCLFAASAASAQCVGDCNGDNTVAINELITGVNIALETTPLSQCPSFDPNGDDVVGINELITAVNNALGTCDEPPVGTERTFTLDPSVLLSTPDIPGSGLFNTGLSGANAANGPDDGFGPGPLLLVLGTADANGVASLRLKEDVLLRIGIIDGSYLCFKMLAEDSDGSVDCDGGTAYDTQSTQSAEDTDFPFEIMTGLGAPAGPGNGDLLVPTLYEIVNSMNPENGKPCDQITFDNPVQTFPFTTTKATSVKGDLILEASGQPFSCANFAMPGSGGALAAGAPATQAPVGAVSSVFRLAEQAAQ